MDVNDAKKMTVAQLRDEAKKLDGVTGVATLKKDDLIHLLMEHGVVEEHHKVAPKTAGKGLDKGEIKRRIRDLKAQKKEALAADDRARANHCNRRIHHFKHKLRKMAARAERST